MRAFACAALALIACRSKPGGIEIVATNAPSAVHFVRVYLGTSNVSSTLDSSTSLTVPAPVAAATQGSSSATVTTPNIFVRDPGNGNDTASYDGHDVTFEFEGDGDTVLAAIVVGYTSGDASGVPVSATVLHDMTVNPHEVDTYPADLGSAGAGLPFLWSEVANASTPLTNAACAGFSGGNGSAFIVAAADDEDCDGYLDGSDVECSELVFNDQQGVSTNATCFFTTAATENHGPQCRLGGKQCIDGSGIGSDSACEPTNTCMANIACGCEAADVATNALGCVAENQQTAMAAGYGCVVGAPVMSGCTLEIPPVTTGGMPCKTTGNHGGLAAPGTTKFTTQPVDVDGYTFTIDIDEACGATLQIAADSMGNTGSGSGGQSAFPNLLVKLVLLDGSSLIYPLVLTADASGGCMGEQTTTCTPAPDDPFTDTLQQCVAGWGARTSTSLSGTSPTLDASMMNMYYLAPITNAIMHATSMGSGSNTVWTAAVELDLALATPPAVALHLTNDGQTLFVTDAGGDVNVFVKSGSGFAASASESTFMPGAQTTWYSPNNAQQTDVVYADDKVIWELTSSNGPPFTNPGSQVATGQTPYMGEDSGALWFADATNGSAGTFAMFVQQRVGSADGAFSPPIAIPEVGISAIPQAPWVQPLPLAAPITQTMFFASEELTQNVPTIYWVQRAPLLVMP